MDMLMGPQRKHLELTAWKMAWEQLEYRENLSKNFVILLLTTSVVVSGIIVGGSPLTNAF